MPLPPYGRCSGPCALCLRDCPPGIQHAQAGPPREPAERGRPCRPSVTGVFACVTEQTPPRPRVADTRHHAPRNSGGEIRLVFRTSPRGLELSPDGGTWSQLIMKDRVLSVVLVWRQTGPVFHVLVSDSVREQCGLRSFCLALNPLVSRIRRREGHRAEAASRGRVAFGKVEAESSVETGEDTPAWNLSEEEHGDAAEVSGPRGPP